MSNTLTLIKARFSKDARISRSEFRLQLAQQFDTETTDELMPSERSTSDALRWGINHVLRPYQRFVDSTGAQCSVIITPIKGKEFKVQIDVKRCSSDSVAYQTEIATVCISDGTADVVPGRGQNEYYEIWNALKSAYYLERYGKENVFETDLRRVADAILSGKILKLWPGIYAALDEDSLAAVRQVQELMAFLDAGDVRVSILNLENSIDNRKALASELADEFARSYGEITARAGKPGPNTELLERELQALQDKRYAAEKILCVVIPCDDAQADAEVAVMNIQY